MGDGSIRPDSKGKGRATPNKDILALDLDTAEEGTGGQNGALMQMQMVEQQVHTFAFSHRINVLKTLGRINIFSRAQLQSNR